MAVSASYPVVTLSSLPG